MTWCKQCPHDVGDSDQRDCAFPDCCGWTITYNPKPIPDRRFDYDFVHDEYDGCDGGNGLCGTAPSSEDAVNQIVEIMAEHIIFEKPTNDS